MTKAEMLSRGPIARIEHAVEFTVAIRTQGERIDVLEEALISVFAQTVDAYEILILLHTPTDNPVRTHRISQVIESLPSDLSNKIRVIPVVGGGRSRPLNVAIEECQGRWLCHLDDDDLFLDHHFELIHQASKANLDSVAFSTFGIQRKVSVLSSAAGATFPYATQGIEAVYYRPFSLSYQIFENALPICNVAVDIDFIRHYELEFDETYDVLEDYRFWMEVERFADIICIPEFTTMITARDNQSNALTDPAISDVWDEHTARLRSEVANLPRVVTGRDLQDLAVKLDERRRWKSWLGRVTPAVNFVKRARRSVQRRLKRLSGG